MCDYDGGTENRRSAFLLRGFKERGRVSDMGSDEGMHVCGVAHSYIIVNHSTII